MTRRTTRFIPRAVVPLVASVLVIGLVPTTAAAEELPTAPGSETTIAVGIDTVTPTVIAVGSGATDTSLTITYRPIDSATVTSIAASRIGYEASLDGTIWWPCPEPSGEEVQVSPSLCNLSNLQPLRTYSVYFRAVQSQEVTSGSYQVSGTSQVAGPFIATTELPRAVDPERPVKRPSPRVNVSASFNAASNSLGVIGSRVALGVGTLPKITFATEIQNKGAVEKHLVVSAQNASGRITAVPGAWGWTSDRSLIFRPMKYWPGNSLIRIVSNLDGVILGKKSGKYLVGSQKLGTTYEFRTARKFVARVDGATKKMKVYLDGQKVQTFPVSLGKNEWETRNGTKVISTAKEANKIYRSESLGLTAPEDQYELEAPWNTRLTPTGEFIHAAPWAYGRLGRYNGSHGCTNMYADDAEWIYKNTIPGDIVFYTNTGGNNVEPWNGPGGLWNIPWSKWLKKSALASGSDDVITDSNFGAGSISEAKPASA